MVIFAAIGGRTCGTACAPPAYVKLTFLRRGAKKMKHEDTEDRYCDDDCCAASGNTCTPLRPDAFEMSDDDKIQSIENDFRHIMHTLGLDLTDDSLRNTPRRVAKMFVREIFSGLNPEKKPRMSSFENKYRYGQMLVEKEHNALFDLRTPFSADSRQGARGLHLARLGDRAVQAQPHSRLLCAPPAGAGTADHANSTGTAKGPRHGRRRLHNRRQTPMRQFTRHTRCSIEHRHGRIRRDVRERRSPPRIPPHDRTGHSVPVAAAHRIGAYRKYLKGDLTHTTINTITEEKWNRTKRTSFTYTIPFLDGKRNSQPSCLGV